MSIIEQASKRLEALSRAGVEVPWAAAGLAESELRIKVEARAQAPGHAPQDAASPIGSAAGIEVPKRASPEATGLEPKGTVSLDLATLAASGHLTPSQTRTALAEEFRHIKRPLLKNARSAEATADRLSLIMVTSALPGDGKTFCSINLAMSMAAEVDMSVLLVDADVVRPDEVLRRLGVHAEKGLLDLLTDPGLKLSDVVLQTNVPKLTLLPTGARNELSTELLASEAMDRLLASLATQHRDLVVVFDSPPLLVTNEAKVLASHVGQVVMVVDASSDARAAVAQAFAAVEQCPIVMSVLNKAPEATEPFGYGYHYG